MLPHPRPYQESHDPARLNSKPESELYGRFARIDPANPIEHVKADALDRGRTTTQLYDGTRAADRRHADWLDEYDHRGAIVEFHRQCALTSHCSPGVKANPSPEGYPLIPCQRLPRALCTRGIRNADLDVDELWFLGTKFTFSEPNPPGHQGPSARELRNLVTASTG
jgi:hypothetical protein